MVDRPGPSWRRVRLLLTGIAIVLLCSCVTGVYHTVEPGQNLYRISKTYGVNESYLARINGISDPTRLPVGTRLFIPGAHREQSVPVFSAANAPPEVKIPLSKPATSSHRTPQLTKAPPPKKQPVSSRATTVKKLHWPLRGKIIHTFNSKAKAGWGRGIEIAVRAGSVVTAAEAGKVIYSGDGVKGYGHLIILQHENDLFTIYGFNQQNLVRVGDFVSKGEKIAFSGTPPSGGQPRLHFEVRKGKVAVDPILYLP